MADEKNITLTHFNIRQSISILIAKLLLIDIIAAGLTIGLYFGLVGAEQFTSYSLANAYTFLTVFIVLGILKICVEIYVILNWLNEYYEITSDYIIHKKGFIFRKTEQYRIDHIRVMDVVDSLFGELLNFGTITLYDIRLHKYLDMYMIHNPRRYAKILKALKPDIETKKDRVKMSLHDEKEDGEPEEDT